MSVSLLTVRVVVLFAPQVASAGLDVAKIEVEAGLQTEEEGKFHIRLDGFAVCGFLRNVGLQEKDVILKFCAVRQRHDDGAAGVDGAGDAVSGGEEGPGDAGVRCVEAGEA